MIVCFAANLYLFLKGEVLKSCLRCNEGNWERDLLNKSYTGRLPSEVQPNPTPRGRHLF